MSSTELTARKKGIDMDWKQIFKLTLSLLIVTAIAAFVLSLVNVLTADTIAARNEQARMQAMSCVLPEADTFSDLYSDDPTIDRISGGYSGINPVGYCVEVSPNGFGGAIRLMVGIDINGSVTGVTILDHSETAGLGAKAEDPQFLNQYTGKSGTVHVNTGSNSVSAITGATITSKAVTEGVNTALTAVLNYDAEGGDIDV